MTMVPQQPPFDLDREFAALKASTADALPPQTVDRAIADAIGHAQRTAGRAGDARRSGTRWLAWPLALAASIAVLSFVVRSVPPAAVSSEPAYAAATAAGDDFMPVVPIGDIEKAADAVVVSARLPRMTLAQLGLPVNPARAADAVDTELLVRPDGAVLAVRFVD